MLFLKYFKLRTWPAAQAGPQGNKSSMKTVVQVSFLTPWVLKSVVSVSQVY